MNFRMFVSIKDICNQSLMVIVKLHPHVYLNQSLSVLPKTWGKNQCTYLKWIMEILQIKHQWKIICSPQDFVFHILPKKCFFFFSPLQGEFASSQQGSSYPFRW